MHLRSGNQTKHHQKSPKILILSKIKLSKIDKRERNLKNIKIKSIYIPQIEKPLKYVIYMRGLREKKYVQSKIY